jgi:hypothetical protein
MTIRDQVLQALEIRALSTQELATSIGMEDDAHEYVEALYHLNQESLIVKHPIIDGGCKTCACGVTYKWRLTFAGRKHLQDNKPQEATP